MPRADRTRTKRLGDAGERAAARHLRGRHYRLIGRNARVAGGEIDLVALAPDGVTIVFVEVKSRLVRPTDADAPNRSFMAEAAIHPGKRAQLLRLAQVMAQQRGWADRPLRIDALAVELVPRTGVRRMLGPWRVAALRHYENAVTLGEGVRRARR